MARRIHARLRLRHPGFVLEAELELPGRGVSALFGHSGSGKTSLLRCIAGLEPAAEGYLEVNGEVWQDSARGHCLPTHRRSLGYVFQEASLFEHLSVRRNLVFGLRRIAARELRVGLEQAVTLLGIDHLLERMPDGLSGGERQRVGIARALLTSPRLLLMDEPLAALDLKRKGEILPYLERLHDELDIPLLYVTHAPDEVARLADHLVVLEGGRVLASGPLEQTLARLDLPIVREDEAGVVIVGRVRSFDDRYQLLELALPGAGHVLRVAHPSLAEGSALRLRVLARDVSLSLEKQCDSSILNLLPARVVEEAPAANPAHVLVRLDVEGTPLLARITRFSRDQLRLHPGQSIWVQIKSVALLV